MSNLFYNAIMNSSTYCKFHSSGVHPMLITVFSISTGLCLHLPQQLISALLSATNQSPLKRASTNQQRLVSMSPAPINTTTIVLSSHSSVILTSGRRKHSNLLSSLCQG